MEKFTLMGASHTGERKGGGFRKGALQKKPDLQVPISNQEPTLSVEGFWSWAKERLFKHHGISPKHFPLYLKEREFRYNHRFELIFEQLVAFMSDFVPELPSEEVSSLCSTSQRELYNTRFIVKFPPFFSPKWVNYQY